jgi:hypothetical protein
MHVLASLYVILLCVILWMGISASRLGRLRSALAVFLLVWAVWIMTSHLLSLFSVMNVTWLFIGSSVLVAVLASAGLRRIRSTANLDFPEFQSPFSPRVGNAICAFLATTAIIVVICNLLLAKGFLPGNPDSIVYRFPRAYWYFSHGSLTHFGVTGDPRPQFYPLNGVIAYLPLLHFQLGPRSFSLMSLACWMVAGLSTYVFARDLGGPRVVAMATAWVVFLTPNVLLQALSTNDELIAAAPLLAGLFFFHRWYYGRQTLDALLGTIGVTISVGTKLHATFYMPLLVAVVISCAYHYRATLAEVRRWLSWRGLSVFALLGVIVFIFSLSFTILNYRASGQIMAWDFAGQIQNKPFKAAAALQNVVLQSAHTVLTPIADLHIASPADSTSRSLHYQSFNERLKPWFTWVDNSPPFMAAGYQFVGMNTPNSVLLNEQTVFIGFTWLVWLIAAICVIFKRTYRRSVWACFHLASFPVWFLTYTTTSRYVEGFATYLCYATVIVGPALVFAFVPIKGVWLGRLRLALLVFVGVTHVFFTGSILLTSPAKNLYSMYKTAALPSSRGFAVDQSVTDEIGLAASGVYQSTISWGQPYWALMAYHPEVRQFFVPGPPNSTLGMRSAEASSNPKDNALQGSFGLMPLAGASGLYAYDFPQTPLFGHAVPIRIADKTSPGLTWIGNLMFALGPEWIFAAGNGVEVRNPAHDRYLVLRYDEPAAIGQNAELALRIDAQIYGVAQEDNLSFRSEVTVDGQIVAHSDWQPTPAAILPTPNVRPGNGLLTIQVRNNKAGTVYSTQVKLQSPMLPSRAP